LTLPRRAAILAAVLLDAHLPGDSPHRLGGVRTDRAIMAGNGCPNPFFAPFASRDLPLSAVMNVVLLPARLSYHRSR
jgi:uncharacterized protein YceK